MFCYAGIFEISGLARNSSTYNQCLLALEYKTLEATMYIGGRHLRLRILLLKYGMLMH